MHTGRLIIAGVIFSGIVGSCCHLLTDEPRCSGTDIEARVHGKLLQLDLKILADKVTKLEEELKEVRRKPSTSLSKDGTFCPDEMTSFRGSCYFSSNNEMTLSSATEFCAARGGRLVVVESSAEQVFLIGYLHKSSKSKNVHYWLGISDMSTEGVWRRLNDDQPVNLTAWAKGEPNGGGGENCAALFNSHDYYWADINCSWRLPALCKISQY